MIWWLWILAFIWNPMCFSHISRDWEIPFLLRWPKCICCQNDIFKMVNQGNCKFLIRLESLCNSETRQNLLNQNYGQKSLFAMHFSTISHTSAWWTCLFTLVQRNFWTMITLFNRVWTANCWCQKLNHSVFSKHCKLSLMIPSKPYKK
jgi:hypothetical protein